MKKMKWLGILLVAAMAIATTACGGNNGGATPAGSGSEAAPAASDNRVVIYSGAEEYRNEYFLQRLNEEFPDYDITIEYMPT